MKYSKSWYFDMGMECARWYKDNNFSMLEFAYPINYNGLSVFFSGSWQATAFKAGFNKIMER